MDNNDLNDLLLGQNNIDESTQSAQINQRSPSPCSKQARFCRCCGRQTCQSKESCIAGVCLSVAFGFGFLLTFLWFLVLRPFVQGIVTQSDISFSAISMSNPRQRSVDIRAHARLSNMGTVPATLNPTTFLVNSPGDVVFAHLITSGPVTVKGKAVNEVLLDGTMMIVDMAAFTKSARQLMLSDAVTWHLSGLVTVKPLNTALEIGDLTFQKDIKISGMKHLPNMTLDSFQIRTDPAKHVNTFIKLTLNNPSIVAMSPVGSLSFDVMVHDTYIATVQSPPNATLLSGPNHVSVSGLLPASIQNNSAARTFISNYISGRKTELVAVAPASGASTCPIYAGALAGIALPVTLDPLPMSLMTKSEMDMNHIKFEEGHVIIPTKIFCLNPMESGFTIVSVNLKVIYQGVEIGYAKNDKGMNGKPLSIWVPPLSNGVWAPEVGVKLDTAGTRNIEELIKSMVEGMSKGFIKFGVQGDMDVIIGDLHLNVGYWMGETLRTCSSFNMKHCD